MMRKPIRRRPRRNRFLTVAQWKHLYAAVIFRDTEVVLATLVDRGVITVADTVSVLRGGVPCPAWVVDPDVKLGDCKGTWQLDHVKKEPRMGVKAEDEAGRLMSLCAAHDERGMKAGHVWNTANRDLQREYLREHG